MSTSVNQTNTATLTKEGMPQRLAPEDPAPVPFSRLVAVELRKLIDTRAGRWLLITIGLVTAAVIVIVMCTGSADHDKDFGTFLFATVVPQSILLPILGIMAVTSEWSQRTGLVTFTLEPRRARIAWSKLGAAATMGVAVVAAAFVLAAAAALLCQGIRGSSPDWSMDWQGCAGLLLMQLIGIATGVAFGMLLQNTPGAIVAYLFIPTVWSIVSDISWMQTVGRWADTNRTVQPLLDGHMSGAQWAHLVVSVLIWVAVPLAGGLWRVTHSEVKSA